MFRPKLLTLALVAALLSSRLSYAQQPPPPAPPSDAPSAPIAKPQKETTKVLHFVVEDWSLELEDLRVVMARTKSGCEEGVMGAARLSALRHSWPIRLSGNPRQPNLGQILMSESASWTQAQGKKLPLFIQLDRSQPQAEVTALFPVNDINGKSQACTFYLGITVPGPAVCVETGPDTLAPDPDEVLARVTAQSRAILDLEARGRAERCDSGPRGYEIGPFVCGTTGQEEPQERNSRKILALVAGVGVSVLAFLLYVLKLVITRA